MAKALKTSQKSEAEQPIPQEQALKRATSPQATLAELAAVKPRGLSAFLRTKKGKITTVIAVVIIMLGVVFAIPSSRYAVAGLVIKKDIKLLIVDATSGKPVSGAQVQLNGKSGKTGADGSVVFSQIPVGYWQVTVTKQYYKDAATTQLVPILSDGGVNSIAVTATGRVTPLTVTNKLTGTPLKNVEITAGAATAITGDDGSVSMVLAPNLTKVTATFKADNYNSLSADIAVSQANGQKDPHNNFALTPAGKIYFLSNRTGILNVMSANLDGSSPSVVVAGTGKEDIQNTVLLASRDWKYLALQAVRDSTGKAKLYLIDTTTNKLTTIDEGDNVYFSPVGWSDHHFIYQVNRNGLQNWDSKIASIKTFDATSGKTATIDDTNGSGSSPDTNFAWAHETYAGVYIVGDNVVYGKHWDRYLYSSYYNPLLSGKKDAVYAAGADGSNKQTIKDFDTLDVASLGIVAHNPQQLYVRIGHTGGSADYYMYQDRNLSTTTAVNDNNFYSSNSTYLVSPSDRMTLWSEQRDGKNVMLVGDQSGANGKELATNGQFAAYGWLSDDYVLLSKDGSQLYIMSSNPSLTVPPSQITAYTRSGPGFPGYGYGYGGGY